jgi:nucleoid DNA-binding protein
MAQAAEMMVDFEAIARDAAERSGLPIKTVSTALEAAFASVADHLAKGRTVHLADLGTFSVPPKQKRRK